MQTPARLTLRVLFLVLVTMLASTTANAQEKQKQEPQTTADQAVDVDILKRRLRPLTKDELKVEVEGWQSLLQKKAQEIAEKSIGSREATGSAKDQFLDELTKMEAERSRLADRLRATISALRVKGGDIKDYEKYLDTVSGAEIDVTDASALWAIVESWLLSKEGGLKWAINIGLFFLTLVAFRLLASIVGGIVRRAVARVSTISDLLRDFFVNAVRKLISFIGLIVALSVLGVEVGPFVAAIGAAGFIIGFALQGTLSNFAAGILILLYRPYDIGDFVDVGGTTGTVKSMSLVSTTLKKPDNQIVIVPNNAIWGGIITNVTGSDTRRVDMTFGIGYSDDIDKAMEIIKSVLGTHDKVLADPEPNIRVHALADSSVNLIARPWSKTSDYWDVYWDVTKAVKEQFDQQGISIPFPQRDVHVHQVTA